MLSLFTDKLQINVSLYFVLRSRPPWIPELTVLRTGRRAREEHAHRGRARHGRAAYRRGGQSDQRGTGTARNFTVITNRGAHALASEKS